jgi:hypothetical protein
MKSINEACNDSNIKNVSKSNLAPNLNMAQKLALFDKKLHSGEVMANMPIGKEVFKN